MITMEPMSHPLDHPVWNALTTQHKGFAEGGPRAWRYPVEVAPFAAIADPTPESFLALESLITATGVALCTAEPVAAPGFETRLMKTLEQLVRVSPSAASDPGGLIVLGPADVAEMLALTAMTKPGPFSTRTHELGRFVGIRVGGVLAAMAGERMHLEGFTEVSAVCTHPDHRGRGYGRMLLDHVSNRIVERGETPFLHCFSDNLSAIELYRRAGFSIRHTMHLAVLGPRGAAS
jgi:predicted GNAT family acetyltransferase